MFTPLLIGRKIRDRSVVLPTEGVVTYVERRKTAVIAEYFTYY